MSKHRLWVAKYRPKNLDDVMLPKSVMDGLKSDPFSNYLFHGTPGTGKTTVALAMANDRPFLKINASLDNSIDMIRSKIVKFGSHKALLNNSLKLVILDEADYLSPNAMFALRGTIEEFEETTRFIFTCNQLERIIPAVRSRLKEVCFDFRGSEWKEQLDNYVARTEKILGENGMTITTDVVIDLFKDRYPDYRSILKLLQHQHGMGKTAVTAEGLRSSGNTDDYSQLYDVILKTSDPRVLYQAACNYMTKEKDAIIGCGRPLVDFLIKKDDPKFNTKMGRVAIMAHKYDVELKLSTDPFIALLALISELSKILK